MSVKESRATGGAQMLGAFSAAHLRQQVCATMRCETETKAANAEGAREECWAMSTGALPWGDVPTLCGRKLCEQN